jgi:hypothetical protein
MAKHRTHSIEFKRRVFGRRVAPALAKRHGISRNLINIDLLFKPPRQSP